MVTQEPFAHDDADGTVLAHRCTGCGTITAAGHRHTCTATGIVEFGAFGAHTLSSTMYPTPDTPPVAALTYLALGLLGEATEALEKSVAVPRRNVHAEGDGTAGDLISELGDVAWYLTRLCLVLTHHDPTAEQPITTDAALVALSTLLDHAAAEDDASDGSGDVVGAAGRQVPGCEVGDLVVAAGRLAEHVKKMIRDDHGTLTPARHTLLLQHAVAALSAWLGVHTRLGLDYRRTWEANIDKVDSRRSRGTMAGSGDRR